MSTKVQPNSHTHTNAISRFFKNFVPKIDTSDIYAGLNHTGMEFLYTSYSR